MIIRKLSVIDIFNGFEHFVEGVSDDKKLFWLSGYSESVIEAAIEEAVLSIEPENFLVIEGIGAIVVYGIFIFVGGVHFLWLLDK